MNERQRMSQAGYGAPSWMITAQRRTLLAAPYMRLVREMSALFVPAPLRPEFQSSLEESLLAAARQKHAQAVLSLEAPMSGGAFARDWLDEHLDGVRADPRWVVGAAVGSAVSIAGIVALVIHNRGNRKVA